MASRMPLSANDRHSYLASGQQPRQCSVNPVVEAVVAPVPMQFLVPKGTATTEVATTLASAAAAREPHRSTTAAEFATSPQIERTSWSAQWASKVQLPGEQLKEQSPSSRVLPTKVASSVVLPSSAGRLVSSDQSCRLISPVGISLSLEPGRCHILTQQPCSNNADNQLSSELSSRCRALSENLEQLKSTMEGKVRACTQATMKEVADRERMEERLHLLWQASLSEEVDARKAAVCRLDSEMAMLFANVNELRDDLQKLMDLMYGELHSLLQSMQGGADSAPQSRQGVQQRGSQCSPLLPHSGRLINSSAAAASVSPSLSTITEDTRSPRNPTSQSNLGFPACVSTEQTVFQGSALVPQQLAVSLGRAPVSQEDVSNSLSRCNLSTEHRLQHAAELLARASHHAAAALQEEQVTRMRDECRYMLEKLLDETVQGCVKYSVVKAAIFQALDVLGTKETDALWRDTCWTLHKIEEWLSAKDGAVPGKDEPSATTIVDVTQGNKATVILSSFLTASATASTTVVNGTCRRG